MRNVINFVVIFAIFMITGIYFPAALYVEGVSTCIIATVLMFILDFVLIGLSLLMKLSELLSDVAEFIVAVITLVLVIIWTPIKLYMLSNFLPGFEVLGGWKTYLVLTLILALFSVKAKEN